MSDGWRNRIEFFNCFGPTSVPSSNASLGASSLSWGVLDSPRQLSRNDAVQRRAGVSPAPLGRQSELTIRSAWAPCLFVRGCDTACSTQSPQLAGQARRLPYLQFHTSG